MNNSATITATDGGAFFNAIKPIYEQFSNPGVPEVVTACNGLEDFIAAATMNKAQFIQNGEAPNVNLLENNNKVLVAYTGGKDSTAEAIRLKKLGYDVHLLFIKGLNRAYPKEFEGAVKIAEILKMPLNVTEVKITGKICHPENQIKNQLTIALMTDWGIKNGFNKFSTGIINAVNANYEYNWTDSAALMEPFKKFMQKAAIGWQYVSTNVKREAENIAEVLAHENAEQIWAIKTSCMGAFRFRKVWRDNIFKKYGVLLAENSCGVCYKCAYAYVVKCAVNGKIENYQYFKKCFETLRVTKANLYDKTNYEKITDWAHATFGEKVGEKVLAIL